MTDAPVPRSGPSPARGQDRRFRQLANVHAAVAATVLPDGTLSLLARNEAGAIAAAEVLQRDGRPLSLTEAIRHLGAARQQAQRLVDQATDHLVALTALAVRELDDELNLSAIARDAGMARQTLYNRLEAVELATQTTNPAAA